MSAAACLHGPYHCSEVSYPWAYRVTRNGPDGPEHIRWSDKNDPQFPCLCKCMPCSDWRALREQVDGPVVLPAQ